ncbi:MAG TPA: histidine kinase [Williamwhitmania sp.]|nr:histidine kinase [Williamwhitmania sp.]
MGERDCRFEWGSIRPHVFFNFKSRLLFGVVTTALMITIIKQLMFPHEPFTWGGPLFLFSIMFVISEGIFVFNQLIAHRYPWHLKTRKRFSMLFAFSAIWFVLWFVVALWFKPMFGEDLAMEPSQFYLSVALFIMFVLIYVFLLIVYNYHQSLTTVMLENEKLQQEKLRLDYVALQDQINPHFLFNNLSTLIAIIKTDPDAAVGMAENFSDVYRYVLQSKEKLSVPLSDELKFIKAYLSLHQIRLGDGLLITYSVDKTLLDYQLAPLSLQFLVENAIKHNVAALTSQLHIEVKAQNGHVTVTNNLNPKKTTYSTNTGLQNLEKRFQFLTSNPILVEKDEQSFTVKLPLIQMENGR